MKEKHSNLGVVIVTYNSGDVILDCLETLFSSAGDLPITVVIVDNDSPDNSSEIIESWASGEVDYSPPLDLPFECDLVVKPIPQEHDANSQFSLHIVRLGSNKGFAAGVNVGLAYLAKNTYIDRFWILNPDCVIPPGTVRLFSEYNSGTFSILGGRVIYYDEPERIQIDGGKFSRWTGVTKNINLRSFISDARPPEPNEVDFISGASMVASREFYETAGPLPEEYFLYYEEVDWALRRGNLPLAICSEARVYHKCGTSIGSPSHMQRASKLSLYYKHRSRVIFFKRYFPEKLPVSLAFIYAKAIKHLIFGNFAATLSILRGAHSGLFSEFPS